LTHSPQNLDKDGEEEENRLKNFIVIINQTIAVGDSYEERRI